MAETPEQAEVIGQTNAPLIYRAIADIMDEMPAIGKDSRNVELKYNFRGVDAVCNAAHRLLARHRVFCTPRCTDRQIESFQRPPRRQGDPPRHAVHAVLTMQYVFYAEDGSNIEVVTVGEAEDSSDKAANKAMAAAYKYALVQLFCIPTSDDPDAHDPAGEEGQTPADKANGFLGDKGRRRRERQQPLHPDQAYFREQADALAVRDLNGLPLGEADYAQIGSGVKALASAVTGPRGAGEWLKDFGRLAVIDDGNDGVAGIAVKEKPASGDEAAA